MEQTITTTDPNIGSLVAENTHALSQLMELLARLSAHDYGKTIGTTGKHGIGKHVRHIIDHYDAFFRAVEPQSPQCLDYEQRNREVVLQTDPQFALKRLQGLTQSLSQLEQTHQRTALVLNQISADRQLRIDSSIGRELVFLASHAVHHMAIISLLVEECATSVPEEFGVHPSTLRHQQREGAAIAKTA